MNKLADVRCTGQAGNQWQVPQGAPSEESTPVTVHLPDLQVILALGEASQRKKIKFMRAVDFPLMQRSKRSGLVWGNMLRHSFGEDAPGMKDIFHILGR